MLEYENIKGTPPADSLYFFVPDMNSLAKKNDRS